MDSLLEFDLEKVRASNVICGVDEAGRGPLAGPVSAAAVLLESSFYEIAAEPLKSFPINDSKKLNGKQREICFEQILRWSEEGLLRFANVMLGVEPIEKYNILGATSLAMEQCIEKLEKESTCQFSKKGEESPDSVLVLIDGRPVKRLSFAHEGIVKGDGKSMAIAMASIIAKVSRDKVMLELHEKYPDYGFAAHKGYATKAHSEAILKHGPCPEHRPTFLRKLLGTEEQKLMDLK